MAYRQQNGPIASAAYATAEILRERLRTRYEGRLGIFSILVAVPLALLAYLGVMQLWHQLIGGLLSALPFAALTVYYIRERREGVVFTTEAVCRTLFGIFVLVWMAQHREQVAAAYNTVRHWKPAWILMTVGLSAAFVCLCWCISNAFGRGYVVIRQTAVILNDGRRRD